MSSSSFFVRSWFEFVEWEGKGKLMRRGCWGDVVRVRKWWWGVNGWEVPEPGE